MSITNVIEMDLRNLAAEVKRKYPAVRKECESGLETLLVLVKKHPTNPKKIHSMDFISPFIHVLDNDKASDSMVDISLNGLTHILSGECVNEDGARAIYQQVFNKVESGSYTSAQLMRSLQIITLIISLPFTTLSLKDLCNTLSLIISPSQDSSPAIHNIVLASLQQIISAVGKKVASFCKANPKFKTDQILDSVQEKPPKSLTEPPTPAPNGDAESNSETPTVYLSFYWFILQDLIIFANGKKGSPIYLQNDSILSEIDSLRLLSGVLSDNEAIIQYRVEYAQLINCLLIPTLSDHLSTDDHSTDLYIELLLVTHSLIVSYSAMMEGMDSLIHSMANAIKKMTRRKQALSLNNLLLIECINQSLTHSPTSFLSLSLTHSNSLSSLLSRLRGFLAVSLEVLGKPQNHDYSVEFEEYLRRPYSGIERDLMNRIQKFDHSLTHSLIHSHSHLSQPGGNDNVDGRKGGSESGVSDNVRKDKKGKKSVKKHQNSKSKSKSKKPAKKGKKSPKRTHSASSSPSSDDDHDASDGSSNSNSNSDDVVDDMNNHSSSSSSSETADETVNESSNSKKKVDKNDSDDERVSVSGSRSPTTPTGSFKNTSNQNATSSSSSSSLSASERVSEWVSDGHVNMCLLMIFCELANVCFEADLLLKNREKMVNEYPFAQTENINYKEIITGVAYGVVTDMSIVMDAMPYFPLFQQIIKATINITSVCCTHSIRDFVTDSLTHIGSLSIPTLTVSKSFKKSVTSVFGPVQLEAITSLSQLCEKSGSELGNCWSLIFVICECLSEYIPIWQPTDEVVAASGQRVSAEYDTVRSLIHSMMRATTQINNNLFHQTITPLYQSSINSLNALTHSLTHSPQKRIETAAQRVKESSSVEISEKNTINDSHGGTKSCVSFLLFLDVLNSNSDRLYLRLASYISLLLLFLKQYFQSPELVALTPSIMTLISSLLGHINDKVPHYEILLGFLPNLLAIVYEMMNEGEGVDERVMEYMYDIIIQGDCFKGEWKPILLGLKRIASTPLIHEGFSNLQIILDDFITEMTYSEVVSVGGVVSEYANQSVSMNVSLTSIGLLWKLVDTALIAARDGKVEDQREVIGRMRDEIIICLSPACVDVRPNIRHTAIQTLFQMINIQRGSFILGDYETVAQKIGALIGQIEKARQNASEQDQPKTPREGSEIRRHHTRDTVEKQFNETLCHCVKGITRFLLLFSKHYITHSPTHSLTQPLIDSLTRSLKPFSKFYCKCVGFASGKEVPLAVMGGVMEILEFSYEWMMKDPTHSPTHSAEVSQWIFSYFYTRMMIICRDNECVKNSEVDDVLMAIVNTDITVFDKFAPYLLTSSDNDLELLCASLQSLTQWDSAVSQQNSSAKYSVIRPKGKMNAIQRGILSLLDKILHSMTNNHNHLKYYRTFHAYVSGVNEVAIGGNVNECNTPFITALGEFKDQMMKRKVAESLYSKYILTHSLTHSPPPSTQQPQSQSSSHSDSLLPTHSLTHSLTHSDTEKGCLIESNAIFTPLSVSAAESTEKPRLSSEKEAIELVRQKLKVIDCLEDGEQAKSLIQYIHRNISLFPRFMSEESVSELLVVMGDCAMMCTDQLFIENDIERKIVLNSLIDSLTHLSVGVSKDSDGNMNEFATSVPFLIQSKSKEVLLSVIRHLLLKSSSLRDSDMLSDIKKVLMSILSTSHSFFHSHTLSHSLTPSSTDSPIHSLTHSPTAVAVESETPTHSPISGESESVSEKGDSAVDSAVNSSSTQPLTQSLTQSLTPLIQNELKVVSECECKVIRELALSLLV